MSIAEKFNIPPALFETIKKMNAEETEYQMKVKALMKKKGITSLGQLSPEEKKAFFNTLDSMHKAKNEEVELDEAKKPVSKEDVVKLLVKYGNNPQSAKKMVDAEFASAVKRHPEASASKIAEVIRSVAEEVELEEEQKYYSIVHKTTKKVLSTHKNLDSAKDEHRGMDQGVRALYYIATSNKEPKTFNMKEKVEQVDELKKSTLASYVDKASSGKDVHNNPKKNWLNRISGLARASEKLKKEEVELEEGKSGTGYELYHKDFSSAMQHAYDFAKKKYNIEIDPLEIDRNVAMGPRKPSSGKANAYRLLDKTGKKAIQVQVANLDNKRYELNMYKEEVELEEDTKSAAEKIETYAKSLSSENIDKKDFMKVASMLRRNKVKDAIKFTMSLDSDPRDYIIATLQNNKVNFKEEVEEINELDKEPGGTLHRYLASPKQRQRRIKAAIENPDKLKKINKGMKSAETKIEKERQKQTGMNPKYQPPPPTPRQIQQMDLRYTHEQTESVAASKSLQKAHDDERKKRGLPDPDYYLKLAAQKKKEIEDMRKQQEKKPVKEEQELNESHFKVGQRVECIKSGMKGTVIKVNKPEVGKYYDVTLDSGKKMKYAPDELKLIGKMPVKEEVEEAKDPKISMKRAALSMSRAQEVVRHQKEIGSIRRKREALRNSFDPVSTVLEAYKKSKMKKEATAKDNKKDFKSGDKLSGKTEPIEINPELKEQKT
jgi:hypothetical protein